MLSDILFTWSVTTYLTITLLTLLLGKFIQVALSPYRAVKEMGLPGPELKPIIGNMHLMVEKGSPHLDLECYLKFKNSCKAFCTAVFSSVTMVPCDVQLIKEILVKEFNSFTDRQVPNINTRPVDRGLIFIEGNHWKTIRNFVSPAFSSKKMRAMNSLVQRATENMTKKLNKDCETSRQVVSMKELFGAYTLDVVASCMFGLDLDSQSTIDDPFVHHAKSAFKVKMSNPFLLLGIVFPSLAPLIRRQGLGFISHQSITFFQSVIQRALHVRSLAKEKFVDFLDLAVKHEVPVTKIDSTQESSGETYRYSSQGLLREDIEAQSVSFFLAGYETTATSLTLLSYILSQHQDVQQKLRDEIQQKLADEMPTYDNVKDLEYLDMCICESLRLFPPSTRVTRKCTRSVDVCGMRIEEGTGIAIPVYALHRDPDVYPKPASFIPERFTPEAKAARNPYYYLPFGLGPRHCVGMRLALLEMKIGMVQLIRNFHLLPEADAVPVEELELACTGLLAPKHDIHVILEPVKYQ